MGKLTLTDIAEPLEENGTTHAERLKKAISVVFEAHKKGDKGSSMNSNVAYLYHSTLGQLSPFLKSAGDDDKKDIFTIWMDELAARREDAPKEMETYLVGLSNSLKYKDIAPGFANHLLCAEKLSEISSLLPVTNRIQCNQQIVEGLYCNSFAWVGYGTMPDAKFDAPRHLFVRGLQNYKTEEIMAMDAVMESCLTKIGAYDTEENVRKIVHDERKNRREYAVLKKMTENGVNVIEDLAKMPIERFEASFSTIKNALVVT